MFGLEKIKELADLELRDSEGTYHREIEASYAEMLRNLPRESFSMNIARDLNFPLVGGKDTYTDCQWIQKIYYIKILWGNIWVPVIRVEANSTDIFLSSQTPQSIPNYYEYFGNTLKFYPAPQQDFICKITCSVLGEPYYNPKARDCHIIDDRYLTFCKYYTMAILYGVYLRDQEGQALAQSSLQSERTKLEQVRTQQNARGKVRLQLW